jgi:4-methylaminobutanoate oxidase (formaldehyde-forming)
MGPDAARIVADCGAPELNDLGYYKVGPAYIAKKHVRAARMSYVGEYGWEITCLSENAKPIYDALIAACATPAGLYAQTSMRIEKGFCAMGHELDGDTSPVEAGLMFAVRKSGGFVGHDALMTRKASGAFCKTVSITITDENAVPLGHEPICLNGKIIGQTSSCGFGYRVGKPIALGHVNTPLDTGTQVQIDIARTLYDAEITLGPLFDPTGMRMKG